MKNSSASAHTVFRGKDLERPDLVGHPGDSVEGPVVLSSTNIARAGGKGGKI